MKATKVLAIMLALMMAMSAFSVVSMAAEKTLVKGTIVEYDLDEQTVTIKTDDGKRMTFVIEDDVALFKLDDRLYEEDEVKIKYLVEDGKNVIKEGGDLKGTKPGC